MVHAKPTLHFLSKALILADVHHAYRDCWQMKILIDQSLRIDEERQDKSYMQKYQLLIPLLSHCLPAPLSGHEEMLVSTVESIQVKGLEKDTP